MNKIQKESYKAPGFTALELNHDLSILLSFSVDGEFEPVEIGADDDLGSYDNW